VELISDYVALKPAGRNFKGLCPFHGEKTPSFVVNPERGTWHCFGCSEGGDLFSFVQKIENLSFVEARERLARRAGVELTRLGETRERASERERFFYANVLAERFFRRELQQAPAVQEYLIGRGLALETIEEFRLGFAPSGWTRLLEFLRREHVAVADAEKIGLVLRTEKGYRDRFAQRVIFPIFDFEGRPIAFGGRALGDVQPKYLNSPETPIFSKGKTLYGLDRARKAIATAGCAVAVEGYMDLIACHQAGFTQAIATLGTALTADHVARLKRYTTRLVLAYDGDAAGLKATLRSAPMFEEAGCDVRVIRLPAGSDPDTYIAEQGRQAFQALIDAAEPILDFQLGLLERKYDLGQEAQRTQMVREAAALIAQMPSSITREQYTGKLDALIARLAAQWHPTDVGRSRSAEAAIRSEIRERQRQVTGPLPAPQSGWRRPDAAAPRPMPVGAPRSRTAAAEEYVLRAVLTDEAWHQALAGRLRPEHFTDPAYRSLADVVLGYPETGEAVAIVTRDPELTRIASGLLVDNGRPPITPAGLEEAVLRLERPWKEQCRRALEAEIGQGLLLRSDMRYQEYLQLVRELGQDAKGED
jgi:DNA primase